MRYVEHESELERCPDCNEAIKCDEPIPCLNQFHEREPQKLIINKRVHDAFTDVLRLRSPF